MKIAFSGVGAAIGLILLFVGINTSVSSDYISSPYKYVGGDAYNFQIEASLRSGQIAGEQAAKAIYISGGLLTLAGSVIALGFALGDKKAKTPKPAYGYQVQQTQYDVQPQPPFTSYQPPSQPPFTDYQPPTDNQYNGFNPPQDNNSQNGFPL